MSARSKKDRKQQKLRKKKKRELANRRKRQALVANDARLDEDNPAWFGDEAAGGRGADPSLLPNQRRGVDELLGMLNEPLSEPSPIQEREETETDIWWGKYSKGDGVARLRMTREKLKTVSTDDEEYEYFFPPQLERCNCTT